MQSGPDSPASPRAVIVGNSDGIGLALTRRLLTVAGLSRSGSDVLDVTAAAYPAVLADRAAGRGGR